MSAMTATKLKAMKKNERELLIRWLKFYNLWMWGMLVDSKEAARFAKEDGLSFATPRRLAIFAGRNEVCERWKVEDQRISGIRMLNSAQWNRLLLWADEHKDAIREAGSVVAACSLAGRAGVRCNSISAMGEAMASRGLGDVPKRSARPKFNSQVIASSASPLPIAPGSGNEVAGKEQ